MHKRIFLTWKRRRLPSHLEKCVKSMIRLNPQWEVNLSTDEECLRFVREEFPDFVDVYLRYKPGILRADIFRVLVLYRYGGVYSDIDVECIRPIDTIFERIGSDDWDVLLTTDHPVHQRMHFGGRRMWMNDFMIAKRGSRFLKSVIDAFDCPFADNFRSEHAVQATGPGLFTRLIERAGGPAPAGVTELPCEWIHPIPDMALKFPERGRYEEIIQDKSWRSRLNPVVAHYWYHTWCGMPTTMLLYDGVLMQSPGEVMEERLQDAVDFLDAGHDGAGMALAEFAELGGSTIIHLTDAIPPVDDSQIENPSPRNPDGYVGGEQSGGVTFAEFIARQIEGFGVDYYIVSRGHENPASPGSPTSVSDSAGFTQENRPRPVPGKVHWTTLSNGGSVRRASGHGHLPYDSIGKKADLVIVDFQRLDSLPPEYFISEINAIIARNVLSPVGFLLIGNWRNLRRNSETDILGPLLLDNNFMLRHEGEQALWQRREGLPPVVKKINVFRREGGAHEPRTGTGEPGDGAGWQIECWPVQRLDEFVETIDDSKLADGYFRLQSDDLKLIVGRFIIARYVGGVILSSTTIELSEIFRICDAEGLVFFSRFESPSLMEGSSGALLESVFMSPPRHPFWNGLSDTVSILADISPDDARSRLDVLLTDRTRDSLRFLEEPDWPQVVYHADFASKENSGSRLDGSLFPAVVRNPVKFSADAENPQIMAYSYERDCGLGEAAFRNIAAMRSLGLTVEHRKWQGEIDLESPGDAHRIHYHHWHPQPHESDREWREFARSKARHIAYWAYETEGVLPAEFLRLAPFMSEIWVPSQFCKEIFQQTGRPVHVLPHALDLPGELPAGLPFQNGKKPLTILFLFDAWSRLHRKNPGAVIRVFKETFRDEEDVHLIIKAHHLSVDELQSLTDECGLDHWITVINKFLDDKTLDDLWGRADIVLSLQRSEGFGLNLAEALARGVPLITTGYGGHLDFAGDHSAFLVPWSKVPASVGSDGWYRSGEWAEPDEIEASRILRNVANMIYQNQPELKLRRESGRRTIVEEFSDRKLRDRMADLFRRINNLES